MYLIGGLGNPEEKHKLNRHNVGFLVLDSILDDLPWRYDKYANANYRKIDLQGKHVLLLKPQTYMNNSGISVKYMKDRHDLDTENIVIIQDDIDLPTGKFKIVFDRGDGGHNGIRSIINQLGTKSFVRIKIGVAPTDGSGNAIKPKAGFLQSQQKAVAKYLLKDFSNQELKVLDGMINKIKEILETIIKSGYLEAMNKYN